MTTPPVRIEQLRFRDFRGIADATLNLPPSSLVVLVGANGSGKSTVLDGAAILLSRLAGRIRSEHGGGRPVADDDIRNGASATEIGVRLRIGTQAVDWTLVKTAPGRAVRERSEFDELSNMAEMFRESFRTDDEQGTQKTTLPVFVLYPTNRAVLDIPNRIRSKHDFGQLAAYEDALTGVSTRFRLFFEWFRNREDIENEMARDRQVPDDRQLQAVRQAIERLLDGFTGLRIRRQQQRMMIRKGSEEVAVDQLSDGEKVLLALAGDLARRLAMANPTGDPLAGSGVVLIDEIELHLHPKWQHRVLTQLQSTFPNCQFIVSTHSPVVLSHAENGTALLLRRTSAGIRPQELDPFGRDAGDLLEDVFGRSARPPAIARKLQELFRLIDDGKDDEARRLLAALREQLGDGEPEFARAEVLLWEPAP